MHDFFLDGSTRESLPPVPYIRKMSKRQGREPGDTMTDAMYYKYLAVSVWGPTDQAVAESVQSPHGRSWVRSELTLVTSPGMMVHRST